jgi:pyruvyltransferase
MIKLFWHKTRNFGDALSPDLVGFVSGKEVEFAPKEEQKTLAVGSIIHSAKSGDIVWGSGSLRPVPIDGTGIRYLSVRGKLTKSLISNAEVPDVFGDPALLLPLYYDNKVEVTHDIGLVPHYVDYETCREIAGEYPQGTKIINVLRPWREVVDEIRSCRSIVSSSLHGIIVSEAYGIPATWAVWSDRLIGGRWKFDDYFSGTGRAGIEPFTPIPKIGNLDEIQKGLVESFGRVYD